MDQRFRRAAWALTFTVATAMPALAAALPSRAAGLWQSTTSVSGPDGKPLANAANVVTLSCVDPATDTRFFTSGESQCAQLSIGGSGADYTIDGVCSQQGKTVQIHETLDYASPQAVTLRATLDSGNGAVVVVSHMQWQGKCLAGMQPGDEGDMQDGVFNKTDNINDAFNQ
ncbi:MAG: DUF3617 family protein [Acidocella sp.]|nr:DUF3617 family protein [Acidocella sp.]